jgi:hypothetical protein
LDSVVVFKKFDNGRAKEFTTENIVLGESLPLVAKFSDEVGVRVAGGSDRECVGG